ncbi:MAG TPA: dockerin type I domain-containing protein [Tepidisphaeraceae bacterium]|jgi:T5SS/PEP-CTERM-associated repeat protein|nr:dockerin type I domain-containing protein [Tepidisphaeraceae bacterium]
MTFSKNAFWPRSAHIQKTKWAIFSAVLAAFPLCLNAAHTTYSWQPVAGNYNGDFYDANHWNPTGSPDPVTGADNAEFSANQTYTVSLTTSTNIFNAAFTAGNVTIDLAGGGFFFTNTGGIPEQPSLQVADDPTNSGQTASLTITSSDGSGNAGGQGVGVGRFSNSTGSLTIDGQNGYLNFFSGFFAAVGYADDDGDAPGNGTLNVINGASFSSPQTFIDGSVHVGNGSSWDNTPTDPIGNPSTLRVGVTGTATMLVDGSYDNNTNGSSLQSPNTLIGRDSTSNGTLTIDGYNTTFTGSTVTVGQNGAAVLNIQHGATATLDSIDVATAYRDAFDTNTVDELNVQYDSVLTLTGALRVGVEDIGTLNVGGTFEDGGTNGTLNCDSAIIGVDAPGFALVANGDSDGYNPFPATLNVTNTLTIGQNPDIGSGQSETSVLNISGGGLVTSNYGILGDTDSASSGQVTIYGILGLGTTAASEWSVTHDLTIGNAGSGEVDVDSGGLLKVGGNIYIARQSTSYGSLFVGNDGGPTTVTAANLYVGGDENGSGGNALVTVQGGQMLISNAATVYPNNSFLIESNAFVAIGVDSAGDVPDLQYNGALSVGDSAPGSLTIDTNAALRISGPTTIGSNGTLSVAGIVTGIDMLNNGSFSQSDGSAIFFNVTGSGSISLTGGSFTAASIRQNSLTIDGGASAHLDPARIGPPSILQSLSIPSGQFDLSDNEVLVSYTSPAERATLISYIFSGYDHALWDGPGINSAAAPLNPLHDTTLGYLDNGSQLDIKYTYNGDANLDGKVNADDYALLDRGFAKHLTGWSNGDFNYDGIINSADYLLIDRAYALQGNPITPTFLAERESEFGEAYVQSLLTSLPEPSLLTACLFAPFLIRRRRN